MCGQLSWSTLKFVTENSNDLSVDDSHEELSPSQLKYITAWKVLASIGKLLLLVANVADISINACSNTSLYCFPLLMWRLWESFTAEDLHVFSDVVIRALQMPIAKDTSPFLVQYTITSIQDTIKSYYSTVLVIKSAARKLFIAGLLGIRCYAIYVRPPKSWLDTGSRSGANRPLNIMSCYPM